MAVWLAVAWLAARAGTRGFLVATGVLALVVSGMLAATLVA